MCMFNTCQINTYIYIYIYTYVHIHIYIYIVLYICIYIYLYDLYVYNVNIYICVCEIHIYILCVCRYSFMVFYWVVAMHNYVYMVQCQYHSDTLAKQISEADLQGVGLMGSRVVSK